MLDLSHQFYFSFVYSGNELSGTVPKELCDILEAYTTRSTDSCDHVACAEGTYNEFGYAMKDAPCMPCDMLRTVSGGGVADDVPIMYLGSTSCNVVSNVESSESHVLEMAETETEAEDMKFGLMIAIGVAFAVLVALGAIVVYVKKSRRREEVPYYADSYLEKKPKKAKKERSVKKESALVRKIRKRFSFRDALLKREKDPPPEVSWSESDEAAVEEAKLKRTDDSPNSSSNSSSYVKVTKEPDSSNSTPSSSSKTKKQMWVDLPRL